jgi:hypothetical protein
MFLRLFLLLSSLISLSAIVGCESGNDFGPTRTNETADAPLYDIYLCASIGENHTYRSGIYGANRNAENTLEKIIDLDGDGNLVDSCAVDNYGNLYWTNRGKNGIFKADPDGTNPHQIVFGLDIPIGLAIDETHQRIYWANWLQGNNPKSGQIGYADLDGNNPKVIIDSLRSGGHILIDASGDKLYISDHFNDKIFQSDLEGGNLSTLVQTQDPEQLTLDSATQTLYWASIGNNTINRVQTDGSGKQTLVTFSNPTANPSAIAFDQNKLLFSSWEYPQTGAHNVLHSSNKDGTNIQTLNSLLPLGTQKIIVKQP